MSTEADLVFARECARGDREALARLEADFLPAVQSALGRMRLTAEQVADVMQAFRLDLLVPSATRGPRIAEYAGRGSLASWLRVSATRMALKYLRKGRREVLSEDDMLFEACSSHEDPERLLLKEACRSEFKEAFQAALESLPAAQRTMLRMQLVDGLTLEEIAGFHQVHRATAARWLSEAKVALLRGTRDGLMRRARVNHQECDSIIRMVQSQLGSTLRRRIARSG